MLHLENAGIEAFDVTTRAGAYCGMIVKQAKGYWNVYFNSDCTRGSARKFQSANEALNFMYDRRLAKGLRVQ